MMNHFAALVALACLVLIAGCGDDDGTSTARVSLSVTTLSGAGRPVAGAPLAAGADTLVDGVNTLVLSRAEVVLREIELEVIGSVGCDSDSAECEEFEAGPVLLDLPLDGGTEQVVAIPVGPGTYDEIKFDVHKVSGDDPAEAAFRQDHPDMVGLSIRVQGTFNGEPFTYVTDLDEEQELGLAPPLVVADSSVDTNLTLRLDVAQWFRGDLAALIDPRTANPGGPNESRVEENIKNSIKAFEDEDEDGDED